MKRSNIRILGVPEGEEEEQKIENLFEQRVKENFPSLAKEIDFQEVQEAQRVPKMLDPWRNMPRHIIITLAKIRQKERILEAAREKNTVTYKGVSQIRSSSRSSSSPSPYYMKCQKDLSKKKKIKNMNSKNDSKLTVINNHT